MKLEEIKEQVFAFVGANPGKNTATIMVYLRENGIPVPYRSVVDMWRKEAGGKVVKRKGLIALDLYPSDLPQHFAASRKRSWRIKRGIRHPDTGFEVYFIEKWEAGERILNISFRTRFFAEFLDKFQDVADARIQIFQEIEGKLERLDTAGKTPSEDGVMIGQQKKRKSGEKVKPEQRLHILMMFKDMAGHKRTRYRRIARKLGNITEKTIERIVTEELNKEMRKAA